MLHLRGSPMSVLNPTIAPAYQSSKIEDTHLQPALPAALSKFQ